jgi:DNA-binding IclR family transcriptional regulator
MADWTLLSNHGLVLAYIARHPQSTVREIAAAVKITEWTAHKIVTDLVREGYIERQRLGRRNSYRINLQSFFRHETVKDIPVSDLLQALGWRRPE